MTKHAKSNPIDSDNFVLQDYLDRIHFVGDVKSNIKSISKLMQCQLFSIPFEDLDVQAGKTISLAGNDIVDKLINRKRGGYCYELNGLFALVLQKMDISYRFVAARPLVNPGENPKTHMAIIVTLEGEEYLVDLGFGGNGIREPLKLNDTTAAQQGTETFALAKAENGDYLLQTLLRDEWKNLYSFDLSHQDWIDFKPANHYNSTHPDSFFTQNLVVVLQNPLGKKILFRNTFKSIVNGETKSYTFEPEKLKDILATEFNLEKL
ncbi:arylamine N-acetyltransferase family protein [Flavobacterium sp. PL02]|uniref:arylamine N-acetyltransferase family protein n=1 Tax=Flavobacterium sp. PL02 TaxID=3088354 RepID=UPI002B22F37A|nr:arylamine N-acetyltransferase [Flavobacterium sp. PL02]MEA9413860.1 arylamine N-acetyltransferase [Flavobacterium sp. PL02]